MICIDANVGVKWVIPESDSSLALSLFREQRNSGERIIAPHFMASEVTNAIWRKVARGLLTYEDAEARLGAFLAFQVDASSPPGLHRQALWLANQFQTRAAYDMHYVALAQIVGCELWTADERLYNAVGVNLPFVRLLTQFQPST